MTESGFPYINCDLATKRRIDDIDGKLDGLQKELVVVHQEMAEARGPAEKAQAARDARVVEDKINQAERERESLLSTCGLKAYAWSGYSVNNPGGFTRISAEWTVPSVTHDPNPSVQTFYSTWIGFSDPPDFTGNASEFNILQLGIANTWKNNTPIYFAWVEVWPLTTEIVLCKSGPDTCDVIAHPEAALPVKPGDRIRASIRFLRTFNNGGGTTIIYRWRLFIMNSTQGWGFSTIRNYNATNTWGDFIQEAPYVFPFPRKIANYSPLTFKNCRLNGMNPHFSNSQSIAMVQDDGSILSVPSEPSSSVDAFTVTFGANKPPSP
ncbi:G1 family endopeptidase [Bacillus cereus]|nr:G1 family endopeptidase [Bacillus cereus]